MTKYQEIGLAASGISGDWIVEIDETLSGEEQWYLQIESPLVLVACQLPRAGVVEDLHSFLNDGPDANRLAELTVGVDVTFIRDDECEDRFFLRVTGRNVSLTRILIMGDDLKCLREAVAQAHAELVGDRALS